MGERRIEIAWSETANPSTAPTATARIERNSLVRSSPRWSMSDMTEPSLGATAGGGAEPDSEPAGSDATPVSRNASASAMVGDLRFGYLATVFGSAAGAAVAFGVASVALGCGGELRTFGSGVVSTLTLTASWTSDEALRNSRMLLP